MRSLRQGAATDCSQPILLKNSTPRRNGPDDQHAFPRKPLFQNRVCELAQGENVVPCFQRNFRAVEFFNRISHLQSVGLGAAGNGPSTWRADFYHLPKMRADRAKLMGADIQIVSNPEKPMHRRMPATKAQQRQLRSSERRPVLGAQRLSSRSLTHPLTATPAVA